MAIKTREHNYEGPGGSFSALVAWDDAAGPRPGVLVIPNWRGRKAFDDRRAEALAEMGYVGFSMDTYGLVPCPEDEAKARLDAYEEYRGDYIARSRAALREMRGLPEVDPTRSAAIGYCLGGKAVLDLARSGSDVDGVVSFHGTLDAPPFPNREITTRVLVLHGWQDPVARPEAVQALADEMDGAKVDWQVHAYGRAMHAFALPFMDLAEQGAVYHGPTDRRSWETTRAFLAEVLS